MWALPRMEDIPRLQCPLHPLAQTNECPGETALLDGSARATTPTGGAPVTGPVPSLGKFTKHQHHHAAPSSAPFSSSKPAASPPGHESASFVYYMSSFRSTALLDDRLQIDCDKPGKHHCPCAEEEEDELETAQPTSLPPPRPNGERKRRRSLPCRAPEPAAPEPEAPSPGLPALEEAVTAGPTPIGPDLDGLERCFRTQLSIDEQHECSPGNHEKRYKRSAEAVPPPQAAEPHSSQPPLPPQQQQLLVGPWLSYSADGTAQSSGHVVVNPLCAEEQSAERRKVKPAAPTTAHLSQLMSKLSFSQEREAGKAEQAGILDWITRVPARVLGSGEATTTVAAAAVTTGGKPSASPSPPKCELKLRNCNLELSPREFDEVLAVLRARTPLSRRRAALRTAKRREKYDRLINEAQSPKMPEGGASTKADVLLGAILRSTSKENAARNGTAEAAANGRPDEEREPETGVESEVDAGAESTLPTSLNKLNKRLSRLKQLLKRAQDKLATPEEREGSREARVKRRIDFSEDREKEEGEAELEDEGEAHCDSSAGASSRRARDASISRCANGEGPTEESTAGKRKSRGKRNLSPIWVNHNNNNVNGVKVHEGCPKTEAEMAAEVYDRTVVPSAKDQERFRRSLENAASMVFHSRTGLPLTSSPAPLRRGSCCFDFDSSLNSVSSKRSALFELNTPPSPGAVSLEEGDRETENVCDIEEVTRRRSNSRNRPQSHALLGSFEESALNGRLEPVSTVHGFTAEIGASGSFCPKHRKLPVTVFFYTLGDNDKVSSPYLAHINLGKKGYQVPRMGTIQVTLLNPLGTVVKMFVVLYDLSDMPARSHTFLRQRTLRDKTLRYLIHLRFMSSKSGRIYLHTDVRMIICRKSDVDTASDFGSEPPKELRSYIHGPTNPKFSPRC